MEETTVYYYSDEVGMIVFDQNKIHMFNIEYDDLFQHNKKIIMIPLTKNEFNQLKLRDL